VSHELLHAGFLRSAERMPDRAALTVQGETLTYAELRERASGLAATVLRHTPPGGSPMVAVFADRSVTAFAGILGSLVAGMAYVPLNPNFPLVKTRQMLERAGCRALIVDSGAESQLPELLDGARELLVVLPDRADVTAIATRWPRHVVVGNRDLESGRAWTPSLQRRDGPAYLLFTSGSTGSPKGVLVTHGNATHFVRTAVERYGVTAADRFSQMFDTTFDLSVFDMFVAWHQGACVCCPSRAALWNPSTFIQEQQLTVWFSVPSLAMMMNRLGALKPARFPSLRWSLFCGERMPTDVAATWGAAASGSVVENLYGPTELTVACTAYRWDPVTSPAEAVLGVVPIGHPLPGMSSVVVDERLSEVGPGEDGELLMTGPQRTPGYWQDEAATARAHVKVVGREHVFYRTGDRVRRPVDSGPLVFLGRVDQQIKVRGHRVELGEVESSLLEVPGVESAAALGWPTTLSGALGIAAFVTGRGIESSAVRSSLQSKLQDYAVPHTIRVLPELPLNANGKVDRQALMARLES
jgi:amino acid adenylation domain-containing protein